ncbi:MAG: putative colanic acid biosynthesis acetyltransferase, partial [Planctomycetes bacterium]|nr:putative colanic acid biosynthesis acetyltransferase [Planctomycetota bacterium]
LRVGSHVWIGEEAWIDNLDDVTLGDNVCISQGAYLCTGSHDATKPDFPLLLGPIVIEDQAWVCAKATVLQGCTLRQGSVLMAGALATKGELRAWTYYGGVPAKELGPREEG